MNLGAPRAGFARGVFDFSFVGNLNPIIQRYKKEHLFQSVKTRGIVGLFRKWLRAIASAHQKVTARNLFVTQRDHGIHASSPTRWQIASQQAGRQ